MLKQCTSKKCINTTCLHHPTQEVFEVHSDATYREDFSSICGEFIAMHTDDDIEFYNQSELDDYEFDYEEIE